MSEMKIECAYDKLVPLCDDPQRLRAAIKVMKATGDGLTPDQWRKLEDKQRAEARRQARDETIKRWVQRNPDREDLDWLARIRLDSLLQQKHDIFALVGFWLGLTGNKQVRAAAVKDLLRSGPGPGWGVPAEEFRRAYFLTELANISENWRPPEALAQWLAFRGYIDPVAAPSPEANPQPGLAVAPTITLSYPAPEAAPEAEAEGEDSALLLPAGSEHLVGLLAQ